VESLMQLIDGNKAPTQVIDGKLIVRRSCGALPWFYLTPFAIDCIACSV